MISKGKLKFNFQKSWSRGNSKDLVHMIIQQVQSSTLKQEETPQTWGGSCNLPNPRPDLNQVGLPEQPFTPQHAT